MIVKNISVLEEAAKDIVSGKNFYDQQSEGIGDYFWDSIVTDIDSLLLYAGIHERHLGLHRMPAKRFPYSIYYEVRENTAYVLAVLPMRQNPTWLKKQMTGRKN